MLDTLWKVLYQEHHRRGALHGKVAGHRVSMARCKCATVLVHGLAFG